MGFQSTVNLNQAFGVVGEIYHDGPVRAQPGLISSGDATQNVVGRVFTTSAGGDAALGGNVATFGAGGSGAIQAVLIAPKNYASRGTTAGGTLAPTLTLANNEIGEFLTMGSIVVALPAAANIGDAVKYNTTTGVIGVGAPGGGEAALTNAKVTRWSNAAAGLAVITLTN